MKREYLPISALAAWTRLNCVEFHDVEVTQLPAKDGVDKGCGIVATAKKSAGELDPEAEIEPQVLMTIPSDLLLSLELVETCAKTDRHLKEVLDSMRDYAMTARGAILLFLLVHILYSDPDLSSKEHIKVSNAWTEYIKFLPASYSLPTLYTIEERELLRGTSLELALDSKILSLEKEFDQLREATTDISFCDRDWWNEDTGRLTFEDWKLVDAMYRSRALEFPGKGHSMVPCIDMVNHASGGRPSALYETDENGNAVLQLRRGQGLEVGDEITITYGDEKGASEMVFSYGFLDSSSTNARQLFLDLDIPADDPLRPAKIAVCNTTPGFRLFIAPGSDVTDWESSFVWWCCVNEEDGLEFRVVQSNQGERELKVSWKGTNVTSSESLLDQLKADRMWGVFQLRAVVILQDRMQGQLAQLRSNDEYVQRWLEYVDGRVIRQSVWQTALKLRTLEGELLEAGLRDIEAKKLQLLDTEAVRSYLITQNPGADIAEDFS
ncbi:SET domain-containing protein [Histoplasma capsulatum G186AR]|uniref:SET domain-containing protein n=2 Tax=Ajellomyces capsulatus TaxID=5037 RepID=C0NHZ7_AJECG|nr:SET domain-containing protein [Histoplasma capsulatum G186AR]EEH09432.1 SET domain-containing protein [Histoplasma capsulatum G186AR]KAG5303233.1 SET domain-containing protein [Histoplasma capsulatum]QSS68831.1 SET domain-containing protein [Histoplasma capsulatum G186AR]